MDFELNDDQRAILAAVATLLDKHAGPARAIELQAAGDYDFALDAAIRDAGFADVARSQGTGALEAALVAESVAQAAGVVSFAAAALVAAGVVEEELPGPISLTTSEHRGPVRFCAHARTLLVLDRCSSPSEPQRQRPRRAQHQRPPQPGPPLRVVGRGSAEYSRKNASWDSAFEPG